MTPPSGGARVLVLSYSSFNRTHGAGITLSNLFAGWPRDRLAMIHCDPVPPSNEVCDRYYVLGGEEIRRLGPFLGMRAVDSTGAGAPSTGSASPGVSRVAKRFLFGNMLPDTGRLTQRLERWIRDFQPTLVYTLLGSNSMMGLALATRERFSTKLAIHFMDDWPTTAYRGGALSIVGRARMNGLVKTIVSEADVRLGISPEMCNVYARRYGRTFTPYMNAIDVAAFPRATTPDRQAKEILYVGSVVPNAYLHSIVDACRAAALLTHTGIRLTILTSPPFVARYGAMLSIAPNVTVGEAPSDWEEFAAALRNAGALLMPVNFDDESANLLRYSLPTKLPAYLACGTPILAYGPPEVAQISYLTENGCALVVDEQNVNLLSAGMARIVNDKPLRAAFTERATELARSRHDLAAMRAAFQAELEV